MKIVVLGGSGEMGRVICTDLAETFKGEIVIADRNKSKADAFAKSFKSRRIRGARIDANDVDSFNDELNGANVLINSANYYVNLLAMQGALANNVHYIDLGGLYHMTLKQLKLNSKFKKKNLLAILGCGSTPGITNIMAGHYAKGFETIDSIDIQFADRDYTKYNMPFMLPYSLDTLYDEFSMRPAVFKNKKHIFTDPISGSIGVNFPKPIGLKSCFYTLHSEVATLPNTFKDRGIKECSFRGGFDREFVDKIKFLIDMGFSSREQIEIEDKKITPRRLSVMLMNRFVPNSSTKFNDIELLRVDISGMQNGKSKRIVAYCKAKTNKKHNIPAGAWDTGVPPSIIAQMIANNKIDYTGVLPSELAIPSDLFFSELKRRDMVVFARNK